MSCVNCCQFVVNIRTAACTLTSLSLPDSELESDPLDWAAGEDSLGRLTAVVVRESASCGIQTMGYCVFLVKCKRVRPKSGRGHLCARTLLNKNRDKHFVAKSSGVNSF